MPRLTRRASTTVQSRARRLVQACAHRGRDLDRVGSAARCREGGEPIDHQPEAREHPPAFGALAEVPLHPRSRPLGQLAVEVVPASGPVPSGGRARNVLVSKISLILHQTRSAATEVHSLGAGPPWIVDASVRSESTHWRPRVQTGYCLCSVATVTCGQRSPLKSSCDELRVLQLQRASLAGHRSRSRSRVDLDRVGVAAGRVGPVRQKRRV